MQDWFIAPLAILALALSGCESAVSVKTPVTEGDFGQFPAKGGLTVSGQIRRFAQRPVYLDPVTPYSTELFRALAAKTFPTSKEGMTVSLNPVMLKHRRMVMAADDGYFSFENVPPGRYYLTWYDAWKDHTVETWEQKSDPMGFGVTQQYNFDAPKGKWHIKQITVRDGQNISKIDF